jgi:hopanoid-associated phosphorylase
MTILAVTGLIREAEIVGARDVVAVAGGGDAAGLAQKLEALHGDIRGVISIGLGGALSPLLNVGDVVVADQVVADGGGRKGRTWDCHEAWRVRLVSRLPQAHQGQVFGSGAILDGAESKAACHERTGALAVDMESHVAASFAAARNLPLAALRVISDDARHVLPPAALVAMKPDGGIAMGRVVGSLARNPLQIPALVRTARGSSRAFAELLRCRDLLGVGLAGADL